ncbi:30S ribosomal protein S17 [Candidatus Woesearchaeota archaeon]|nr:30S ribosomal protein S17 [Candidatus Woesearchaeota archaeon]
MTEARNIGVNVEAPRQECHDSNCPFHGKLSVRGRQFTGVVISTKMRRTAVIEFERLHFLLKYERYEKRRTNLKAHNPDCVSAKDGEIVMAMECRPLSKTKNLVIVKKVGLEKGFKERMGAREASKVQVHPKEEISTGETE